MTTDYIVYTKRQDVSTKEWQFLSRAVHLHAAHWIARDARSRWPGTATFIKYPTARTFISQY